jgi:hypothetical protein
LVEIPCRGSKTHLKKRYAGAIFIHRIARQSAVNHIGNLMPVVIAALLAYWDTFSVELAILTHERSHGALSTGVC